MPSRRLCFVGWADHVHLERWAGYFARHGDRVSVVSFAGPGRYPEGVLQHGLGLAGRGARWHRARLRYLFWRLRPRLVHVHWAHFSTLVREAWRGPLVVTAWGSDIYRRERFTDDEWSALGRALAASDLVTCDSEDLAAEIRGRFGIAADRVCVIQWGVDTELFSPEGPDQRESLGLQGREIVYSARNFTPVYNQETVVRAFALLRERRPDAFLLMKCYGGDAAYRASIESLIAESGLAEHVRILDGVEYEKMPLLYRSADVTVSVPFSDATPMSLLEAMACGSPCVVGDLPSLREWVETGRTGFLVEAVTPLALAGAMDAALQAGPRREAIREAARRLVVERASQHAHMAAMAAHYDRLAPRG